MPLNGLSSRLLFLLLLESVVLVTFTIRPGIEGTIYVPGNFPTIQGAINAASSGDTVYVRSGTYNEDIVINKTVSLVGENKETTCIYGQGGRIAVYVEADSVVVTGFTIKSLGGQSSDGIDLNNVRNCEVSENNVLSSFFGICVFSCSDCTIQDNHVWKNQYGVGGCSCSNCSVSGNEAANNQNGIAIDMS
jgi:parallel beta-helix repeat protein